MPAEGFSILPRIEVLLFANQCKKGRLRGRILAPKVTWLWGQESGLRGRDVPSAGSERAPATAGGRWRF